MNIYDIANLSGVSITTVSRVLNGSSAVSQKTREKVLSVMEDINYTPNAFARGLGNNSMHTIGILVVDPADRRACSSLSSAIGTIQRELRYHNYDSVIYCVGYDMADKAECLQTMIERRVDAIIIMGSFFIDSNPSSNQCIADAAQQVPVMLINGQFKAPNVYCLLCDDFNSSKNATEALIDRGAKQILMLHQGNSGSEMRKILGYKKALKLAKIIPDERYILDYPSGVHECADFLLDLSKTLPFDAVLATEDGPAMGALKYANRYGIRIPEEFQVIGYNNTALAEYCYPELTSVDNNTNATCITAVNMLIHLFQNVSIPSEITLSSNIVFRETTRVLAEDNQVFPVEQT